MAVVEPHGPWPRCHRRSTVRAPSAPLRAPLHKAAPPAESNARSHAARLANFIASAMLSRRAAAARPSDAPPARDDVENLKPVDRARRRRWTDQLRYSLDEHSLAAF